MVRMARITQLMRGENGSGSEEKREEESSYPCCNAAGSGGLNRNSPLLSLGSTLMPHPSPN